MNEIRKKNDFYSWDTKQSPKCKQILFAAKLQYLYPFWVSLFLLPTQ